ncbi:phospholipid scramblase 1-like isoform X2 [Lepidochelys kempii]|uniref:phospholipid scramblase 1-like isoform X2 n=1 Tax=Lepidochelys kempii TaxID=8472 RepID=UPI003C6FA15C
MEIPNKAAEFPNPTYPPTYAGNQVPHGYPQYAPQIFQNAPEQANYAFQGYPAGAPYGPGVPPVQNQPSGTSGAAWIPAPPPTLNCSPGLEYLSQIDQILVHQQIELLEVLTGFETNNKYEIKNSLGQRVYFAAEENDCCTRNCCGPSRSFTIRIIDNMGQEVITLQRPLRCSACCCPCCLQEVKSMDESSVVGRISKQWSGFVREAFTDADNFGIQFPLDLDVKMKAVMIGACFLIDFMFFEQTGNKNQRAGVWQ